MHLIHMQMGEAHLGKTDEGKLAAWLRDIEIYCV
jgi:hypothetical protein